MITYHPFFGIMFAMIPLIGLFCIYGLMFNNIFSKGKTYSDYPNSLEVIESQMSFGEKKEKDGVRETVVILGTIKNNSDVAWEKIDLEIKVLDENSELIDVEQAEKYFLIVPPNDKAAFKVYFDRQFSREKYSSHSVRVLSASEVGHL